MSTLLGTPIGYSDGCCQMFEAFILEFACGTITIVGTIAFLIKTYITRFEHNYFLNNCLSPHFPNLVNRRLKMIINTRYTQIRTNQNTKWFMISYEVVREDISEYPHNAKAITPPKTSKSLLFISIKFSKCATNKNVKDVVSNPDVLFSTIHMFLYFENFFSIMDIYFIPKSDIIPGIPQKGKLGGFHILHIGVIDCFICGEIIHTHSIQILFTDLILIGEVSIKMYFLHITSFLLKDTYHS